MYACFVHKCHYYDSSPHSVGVIGYDGAALSIPIYEEFLHSKLRSLKWRNSGFEFRNVRQNWKKHFSNELLMLRNW